MAVVELVALDQHVVGEDEGVTGTVALDLGVEVAQDVAADDGPLGVAEDVEGVLAVVVVGAGAVDDEVLEGPVRRRDLEPFERRGLDDGAAERGGAHDDAAVGGACGVAEEVGGDDVGAGGEGDDVAGLGVVDGGAQCGGGGDGDDDGGGGSGAGGDEERREHGGRRVRARSAEGSRHATSVRRSVSRLV